MNIQISRVRKKIIMNIQMSSRVKDGCGIMSLGLGMQPTLLAFAPKSLWLCMFFHGIFPQ